MKYIYTLLTNIEHNLKSLPEQVTIGQQVIPKYKKSIINVK